MELRDTRAARGRLAACSGVGALHAAQDQKRCPSTDGTASSRGARARDARAADRAQHGELVDDCGLRRAGGEVAAQHQRLRDPSGRRREEGLLREAAGNAHDVLDPGLHDLAEALGGDLHAQAFTSRS
jgi:hypothetical protein